MGLTSPIHPQGSIRPPPVPALARSQHSVYTSEKQWEPTYGSPQLKDNLLKSRDSSDTFNLNTKNPFDSLSTNLPHGFPFFLPLPRSPPRPPNSRRNTDSQPSARPCHSAEYIRLETGKPPNVHYRRSQKFSQLSELFG